MCLSDMKPELQRIKIAEACGWKGPHHPDNVNGMDGWWSQHRGVWWMMPDGERVMISGVPDYLNDQNAMHEAVLTLDRKTLDYSQYCSYLQQILAVENSKTLTPGFQISEATAAQRAEAFLRALNLWEGS